MRSSAQALVLIFSCSLTANALGQTLAGESSTAPPAATGSPNRPNISAPQATGLPDVQDAMLAPVEAPTHVLKSWPQALSLVRDRSTSLAIAQARITLAQSQSRQALAANYPTLSANAGVTRLLLPNGVPSFLGGLRNDGLEPQWRSGISVNQRLLDLQGWDNTGIARQVAQATEVRAQDAERLALGALADTIVGVITTERLAEVSRVSLRSNLSTLDLTRRRARLGAASAVDVLRAEQEVTSNRSDVIVADESLRRAREALGVALGDTNGWGVSPQINVQRLAQDARAVCSPTSAKTQRSDVRAAQADVAVAERRVGNSRYAYAPTVDVSSSFSYTSPTGALRPTQWQIRAVLSIPLYDGGRTAAVRDEATANLDISRQQLTFARRAAQLEVVQTGRSVKVAERNYSLSQEARKIAKESARLAHVSFVHGTGTSFDLVESARRRRLAEIDVTLKEFEVVRARITALLAVSNCSY